MEHANPSADREAFERQGYVVLPALLQPPLTDFFWSYVHTRLLSGLLLPGDGQVPHAPCGYGDPTFDGLLEFLRPRMEKTTGRFLLPTYSYFRVYKNGDALARHIDRPACEFSVSLNIGQISSDPWPLHIEGAAGTGDIRLSPGDAVLYRGTDHAHWRERFEGKRLVQVFLHYVDRNGPHAGWSFDKRQTLMRPRQNALAGDAQNL